MQLHSYTALFDSQANQTVSSTEDNVSIASLDRDNVEQEVTSNKLMPS